MCKRSVEKEPRYLTFLPDRLKKQKMSNEAVEADPYTLKYVSDWFVTQQQIKIWYDNLDDGLINWYKGYQEHKARKAKIKEELMPIAWHPDRVNWCMSEDKKRWWK